ncbi:hypothetical protein M5D96_002480 [Drosophila gunungcola]|uniref:Uncharacterized protein n=1 Tax=Drosophila gunungcola TaxID=103775 RepID=A0A9P9Z003_9MUSC|nr:hypothetical protein M5D96_002480 [Drosophila gunungcola]
MANAIVQVSDKSVLPEEMTTTSQMEMNTNGGGLDSTAAVSPLLAGNSSCLTPGINSGNSVQKNATIGMGLNSTQRAVDATKRKKLKSRAAAASSLAPKNEATAAPLSQNNASKTNRTELSYSKDHLDAWLENCLRDATNAQFHRYPMLFPPQNLNGYALGYGGDGGQEFASLPPLVNMMGGAGGTGSEHGPNSTDVLDGSGSNPNFSRGFRFSDPCLLNPSDNDSKLSGQNTPECRNGNNNGSGCDLAQQNKFFAALMEQINILHDTNSKICRNLHETKVDIEALKHAPSGQPWAGVGSGGMRHRRDSLSGLSTQSQPLVFGGGMGGTHSPAPTFHSGAYTPGMMTDVVREVKEAARVREDALLSRVKSMVEERQWSLNEGNVRILRDIDDLKAHVMQLRLERKETNKRLSHLEAENKCLRQALAGCYSQRQSYHDIIYENDRARGSRKPFPNGGGGGLVAAGSLGVRRAQSFNLHYGTMHQTPTQATHSLEEDDEIEEEQLLEQAAMDGEDQSETANKRLSCSSNESRNNGLQTASTSTLQLSANSPQQSVRSAPTFALISDQVNPGLPPPLLPRKKEHAQLKRELSEVSAARKEANQRIIALEKLVKDLSAQVASQPNWNPTAPGTAPDAAVATKFSVADGPITDL